MTTVQRFQEGIKGSSYSAIHRSFGGTFIIDSDNRVRYFGQTQSAAGTSPSWTWLQNGAGSASSQSINSGGMIISPEYLSAGEYAVKVYGHHRGMWILTNLGNLYAAGENGVGQLGLGFVGGTTVFPRKCAISNVIDFDVCNCQNSNDLVYCIAIRSNGSVWTWGYNNFGNCGTGNAAPVTTPTEITAINNASNAIFGKQMIVTGKQ